MFFLIFTYKQRNLPPITFLCPFYICAPFNDTGIQFPTGILSIPASNAEPPFHKFILYLVLSDFRGTPVSHRPFLLLAKLPFFLPWVAPPVINPRGSRKKEHTKTVDSPHNSLKNYRTVTQLLNLRGSTPCRTNRAPLYPPGNSGMFWGRFLSRIMTRVRARLLGGPWNKALLLLSALHCSLLPFGTAGTATVNEHLGVNLARWTILITAAHDRSRFSPLPSWCNTWPTWLLMHSWTWLPTNVIPAHSHTYTRTHIPASSHSTSPSFFSRIPIFLFFNRFPLLFCNLLLPTSFSPASPLTSQGPKARGIQPRPCLPNGTPASFTNYAPPTDPYLALPASPALGLPHSRRSS